MHARKDIDAAFYTHISHVERYIESATTTTTMAGFWCDMMTISCMQRKKKKIYEFNMLLNVCACTKCEAPFSQRGQDDIIYIKLSEKLSSLRYHLLCAMQCKISMRIHDTRWHGRNRIKLMWVRIGMAQNGKMVCCLVSVLWMCTYFIVRNFG